MLQQIIVVCQHHFCCSIIHHVATLINTSASFSTHPSTHRLVHRARTIPRNIPTHLVQWSSMQIWTAANEDNQWSADNLHTAVRLQSSANASVGSEQAMKGKLNSYADACASWHHHHHHCSRHNHNHHRSRLATVSQCRS